MITKQSSNYSFILLKYIFLTIIKTYIIKIGKIKTNNSFCINIRNIGINTFNIG